MSLMDKLKSSSTIKETSILSESKFFNEKPFVTTEVPAINIAFSGKTDGGFTSGLTVFAGPSKHFKTSFALLATKAYLDKYKDSICLFYDSEFGTPQAYFDSFGIDRSRVLHTPITDVEQLKFDIMKQLGEIKRNDKIIIVIDSIGNLASKKEVEDALAEKSVADMSRAKQMKSLFRMVTPHLNLKDIPLMVINHIYMEQGMYPKAIVSGGCLASGTEIQMFDGSMKEIQNIKENDMVRTLNGSNRVTNVWTPETLENGTPECFEIVFEDGYSVTCSADHPFLTTNGWVDASELSEEHEIVSI